MRFEEHDACGVGFLADLGSRASHQIVSLALTAVGAMEHRGARAADGRTGDGAGILLETPRALFLRELALAHVRVPERHLAAVCVFLPRDEDGAAAMRARVEQAVRGEQVAPMRWRVPEVDPSVLGTQSAASAPSYEQLLVDMGPGNAHERMRAVRRAVIRALREENDRATLVSASPSTVVYKGLLSSSELGAYFADLRDPACASRFAVFHQRFSTNTAPSWRLVQPFGAIAHNGEIDTITGNRAWMRARGIVSPRGASDSLEFDVALDAMVGAGYRVDEAVDIMLSPAIDDDDRLRAYYDAHVPTVEPWDGPAAIVFAEGDRVGAALDRSGFRPLRWCRTASGKILAASEAGIVDFGDDPIVERGRLGPGERIVVRFATGELIRPETFRAFRRDGSDFRATVASWRFDPPADTAPRDVEAGELRRDLVRFGYTQDELKQVVSPLAAGAEPVSSMGDDAALPFFERRMPVTEYLRQRFAQVTNPPIDALREGFVFDVRAWVGSGATNGDVPAPGSIVNVDTALLEEGAFDALAYDTRLVTERFALDCAGTSLRARITAIADEAERKVREGATYLVLDDRGAALPVPAILAAGAVHQRLTDAGLRLQASIAACDGFARDAHACAALIASGANIVTPWLAARAAIAETGSATPYLDALRTGLVKILAKLGICTLRSYVGAQTFEALGLAREVVTACFPGMAAHVPTLGFDELEEDLRSWSALAAEGAEPPQRGMFRFRRDGVRHAFDPPLLKGLRKTIVARDEAAFLKLSDDLEAREAINLRDLIEPVAIGDPLALDQVEPESAILARFVTAAMSLGALGPEAHEAVALGAKIAGARSNGGEGGEDPARTLNAIKQVASARFGVSAEYLATAEELEIKIAQGAKPGEGGQIPGFKVTAEIAWLRGAAPGQSLVSPPPHHDIYSIEDLAQLIYDLRRANAKAKIAVKLVAQSGIGYVASGVAKARADVVHIAGHDGGTGASPLGSIKHAGLPWELGLVETHHTLVANGLRGRVRLRVDGGFKSGRDVIVASMLGADMFGFGSALLVALGCIYARQCHQNTCPVGIATQDAALRKKFPGTAEDAETFLRFVARDVRRRLAALGARSLDEIQGRSDLVRPRYERAKGIELDEVLRLPETRAPYDSARIDNAHLDDEAIPGGTQRITPADRAVGARLAYDAVVRKARGEYVGPATYRYAGSAGQSFGAFLAAPLTLELDGEANDGAGKGMSSGVLVVRGAGNPGEPAIGNACFYGARGGDAYIRGSAGERLAVRNSGATIVVEGAGDHACEYMTKGTVVILGATGRNLASGMTGGELYVLRDHAQRLGPTPLVPHDLDDAGRASLRVLLAEHALRTCSARARELLAGDLDGFVRIAVAVATPAAYATAP
ncbi:glutamate synthase large subunit [Vulcanimicrobium alpinum]|uniref:Glutamate synthase large subunit n=1 Tax=Vulcanimicrobium alpinum TaxID=3016050 RepID=A0AAN2C971_UNVUL|nr:glutamate synthase large subunit [Vulcanimicrobium alpinum]BDE05683.1 glutamate synthase large subunit [Vulcanimicrobium alpinum]